MKTIVTKTDWLTNSNSSSETANSSSSNLNSKNEIDTIGINRHEIDFDKKYIDLKKYKLDDALISEKFNKSNILYLKDEINICKYPKCKLKSIDEYEYCYQHIDLINKKRKLCKWVDKNSNERCDQPAFDLKNGSSDSNGEYIGLCINHLALKKINKLRKYDKYKLIKDNDENEEDQQPACSSSSISNIIDSSSKNDLNEMKFLRDDTQIGETRRINRKNLMKQIKTTNNKDIFKSKKKIRHNTQLEVKDDDQEENEEDEEDNEIKNDLIYTDKLDLDNDLDLLDSSDSLDQTIYNLIKTANPKLFKTQENGCSSHELENKNNNDLANESANDNKSSIKFDYDNALSKTGIYTREEVVKIFKCKLSKLQLLYKKQLAILNDKLIYDRKKYLIMRKNEVEPIMINGEKSTSSFNSDEIKLLKASRKYQSINKKENYMKQKYDPKYFSSKNSIYNTDYLSKCNYISQDSANSKCNNQTLPLSKYCKEHILNDTHQILFGECGYDRSGLILDEANKKLDTLSSCRCTVPIIASIQPRCPIHLSNVAGLLTTNELAEMNKLNIDKLNYDKNKILNLPDHLTKLANNYKEEFIKKQKDNLKIPDTSNQIPSLNSLIRIKEELVEDTNCIIINEKMSINNEDDNSNISELSIKKEQIDEQQQQQRTVNDEMILNENSTNRSLSPPASSIISASTSNQANNLANKSISTSDSSSESSSSESSSTSSTSSTSSSSETDTSDESDEDDTSTSDTDDDDSDTSTTSSSSTKSENFKTRNESGEIINLNDLNNEQNSDESIEINENKTNDNNDNNTSNNNE